MSAEGAAVNPEPFPDQAIGRGASSPDLALRGAFPTPAEVDVLRNSLSAVMVEHHAQSKKLTALAAGHARQSREVAALSAQNLELSRNTAALRVERDNLAKACADAAGGRAAAEAERDDLRYKYDDVRCKYDDVHSKYDDLHAKYGDLRSKYNDLRLEYDELLGHHGLERERSQQLEKRLCEIESSNSWRATRRLRAFFARHPRLRRLAARRRSNAAIDCRWQSRFSFTCKPISQPSGRAAGTGGCSNSTTISYPTGDRSPRSWQLSAARTERRCARPSPARSRAFSART